MPAPRGRQISSFGGFLDPFAVGASEFSRVLVQPDNVRVIPSLESVTLTKTVHLVPEDLQVNLLLEGGQVLLHVSITPNDILVFTSLKYKFILPRAYVEMRLNTPSASIWMETPSGILVITRPSVTLKEK